MRAAERLSRAAALFACLSMAGCSADSVARRDTIAEHLGDAYAANKAIHIVDPWPRRAFDQRLPSEAERASLSISRYRKGEQPGQQAPSGTGLGATNR